MSLLKRNAKCECGSGLKFKKCHGDPVKTQVCAQIGRMMFAKLVTEARYRAKLITKYQCDVETSRLNEMMIDLVVGKEPEEGESAPATPEPEPERSLTDLQIGTEICAGCGRRLPTGMACAKCGKVTNETTRNR